MVSYRHLLAGWFVVLAGCAGSSTDGESSGASSDLAVTAAAEGAVGLEAGVREIGAVIEQTSGGNDYLAIDTFSDAAFTARVGAVLTGTKRRAAILDCAVYGGGQAVDPENTDEDFAKYIDRETREEIAAALDEAIGDGKVHRINSFGIGNPGDDFAARCTVAVEQGAGKFLVLQGHGNDSIL